MSILIFRHMDVVVACIKNKKIRILFLNLLLKTWSLITTEKVVKFQDFKLKRKLEGIISS